MALDEASRLAFVNEVIVLCICRNEVPHYESLALLGQIGEIMVDFSPPLVSLWV